MKEELYGPVAYLENDDIDDKGNITNTQIPINKPVVVMIQASFCGHCNQAKPAFQEFAEKTKGSVFCATIHADGEKESEKKLAKRVNVIKPGFRGFPDYVLFSNGSPVQKEIKGRDVDSLIEFSR